jgi:3-methylcrotonyl-CoA carboxylase alpha subunit/geranyl-CoA carboxylase alpha subunit
LYGEVALLVRDAGLASLWPQGSPAALAVPFIRPIRLRHRDASVDVPVRESEQMAAAHAHAVAVGPGRWHVQLGAVDLFVEDASFDPPEAGAGGSGANELRAPFNGKVIAVKAQPGAAVAKGDPLVILESMKLEHSLAAARDGVVRSIHVELGQQASTAQVLVTLEAA